MIPRRWGLPSPSGCRWYLGTGQGGSRWNLLSKRGSSLEAEGSAAWKRLYTWLQAGWTWKAGERRQRVRDWPGTQSTSKVVPRELPEPRGLVPNGNGKVKSLSLHTGMGPGAVLANQGALFVVSSGWTSYGL